MLFETQNKGEVKMKIFDKNYDLESMIEHSNLITGTMKVFDYDLESVIGRSNLITDAMKVFGDEEVFMKCSDSLSYIFKNSTEAISFIIYRVKEMEPELAGIFTKCNLYYVPCSGHKILHIHTNVESYWINPLESFYYNKKLKKHHLNLK
jgi:hypothetical protein